MIAQLASQGVVLRQSCLRNSYVEISRFLQTRHHGITSRGYAFCFNSVRCFNSSIARPNIDISDGLRKTLDDYKTSILPGFKKQISSISTLLKNDRKVGEDVLLIGYLSTRRDVSKNLSFSLLRSTDQAHCVQLVSTAKDSSGDEKKSHAALKSLKEWTPVLVKGTVSARSQPAQTDRIFGMQLVNDKEIQLHSIEALNDIPNELILKDGTIFPAEQRHLQLRTTQELRENIKFRCDTTKIARSLLDKLGFTEVETPILFKSTPEGAREFLVPTRDKGLAYALPQSPQQYKQILMASGISQYYQFARCFRDEDLRADRQPEFTQLDMEMSFSGEHDVMNAIEELLVEVWNKTGKGTLEGPFPRMTYQKAMATYGSDKPDLRLGMEIHTITDKLPQDLISKISSLESPSIDAFKFSVFEDPKVTRNFVSDFLDSPQGKPFLENPDGGPGVFIGDAAQPMQGLGPLGYSFVMDCPEELSMDNGDLLILQARENEPFSGGSTSLGNLRLALHRAAVDQGLIDKPDGYEFVWIVDFPLFSPSNDTDPGQGGSAGLSSTHHPFTAPKTAEDAELLLTAPGKVVAAHYDIVVNGVELGGGSRRIHNAEVQEFIFRDVLKMNPTRLEDFRHLLDVLRSGCPPHAGIALGWDRLIAVMLGKDSVRDVIAFPKSGKGEDLLVKSPNGLTKEQLDVYHLQLKE